LRELNLGLAGLWYNPKNLRTAPAALDYLDLKTQAGKLLVWKPWFSSWVTGYRVQMIDQSDMVEVTPVAYWPNDKKLTVNGAEVKSGATYPVKLGATGTKIAIAVTGNDGSTRTYTVQVQR
jgi:hypothetical protein